ncbi:HYD1 signature containing ADP-ribosyltransferase family protein [Streptomyces kroppenstedtii]|uniref:HYD1 signature containing ADP-ribosyltransferase family protein n=1 Tax=Streptomyces kroppenstedtii TaxID=3051181 RepID=UPI0034D97431
MFVPDHQQTDPAPIPSTLLHYTDVVGYEGILATGLIYPSKKDGSRKDAYYGTGQYLTDIRPGQMDLESLSQAIYGGPLFTYRISHYLEIDVSALSVIHEHAHIYRVSSSASLEIEISRRRISSGKM